MVMYTIMCLCIRPPPLKPAGYRENVHSLSKTIIAQRPGRFLELDTSYIRHGDGVNHHTRYMELILQVKPLIQKWILL
jgi:hypothetical protein